MWEERRANFEEFVRTNGFMPRYNGDLPIESHLYNWRTQQITQKNKGLLQQSRIDALNRTEGWMWNIKKKKATFREIEKLDTEPDEVMPKPKRRRLEIPWTAQKEQEEFVQKISVLEELLKEKEAIIQRQLFIMERQYDFIETLKKAK